MKGPVLAQKRADSNDVLVVFKKEIGRSPISPLNLTKTPLESTLFYAKTGPFIPMTNFNHGNVTISKLSGWRELVHRPKFRELNYAVGADGQMTLNFARRIMRLAPSDGPS